MMKATHRAYAPVFVGGLALVANALPGPAVHPAALGVAVLVAPYFSSGNRSPDIDHRWWPGRPKPGYPLNGHRGITHRWWFGLILTGLLGVLPMLLLVRAGLAWHFAVAVLGPSLGWLSHLHGDMWFGRLRVLGKARGLGWETGGVMEIPARHGLEAAVLPLLVGAVLADRWPVVGLLAALLALLVGWSVMNWQRFRRWLRKRFR